MCMLWGELWGGVADLPCPSGPGSSRRTAMCELVGVKSQECHCMVVWYKKKSLELGSHSLKSPGMSTEGAVWQAAASKRKGSVGEEIMPREGKEKCQEFA